MTIGSGAKLLGPITDRPRREDRRQRGRHPRRPAELDGGRQPRPSGAGRGAQARGPRRRLGPPARPDRRRDEGALAAHRRARARARRGARRAVASRAATSCRCGRCAGRIPPGDSRATPRPSPGPSVDRSPGRRPRSSRGCSSRTRSRSGRPASSATSARRRRARAGVAIPGELDVSGQKMDAVLEITAYEPPRAPRPASRCGASTSPSPYGLSADRGRHPPDAGGRGGGRRVEGPHADPDGAGPTWRRRSASTWPRSRRCWPSQSRYS